MNISLNSFEHHYKNIDSQSEEQVKDLLTCAGAADDAVVYDGTAVDGDLQTVMSVVMLS